VTYLTDGPETFDTMLGLIDAAAQWIHFENYIIRSDATGERFAEHLASAAGRGVQVHVLYDHLGSRGTKRSYWKRLTKAGVYVRAFNRLNPFRPLRSVRRNHRKYVGIDGGRAVVGGLCIGDEWSGPPYVQSPPWRDTAVLLVGPTVPLLDATFLRNWEESGASPPNLEPPEVPGAPGSAAVRVIDGIPGRLRLFRAIQFLVASAADRLWITDAYLVAPSPIYAGLIAAARDGVDVRLLVPGRTDIPAVRALTRVGYRELLEAGVRIWEWHGPMLHAKTVIADELWFKVGSSNLNPSSLLSNHELDVLIEDTVLPTSAAQQFRRDLNDSVEIVLRGRRGPERLAARLPPAVVPVAVPPARGRRPTTRRELQHRAVMTLSQVARGARRSIAGALLFVSLGAGVLFVALPRMMAYALAAASFGLAALAAWEFLRRRAYREE
jgi:cardiolipin synthase